MMLLQVMLVSPKVLHPEVVRSWSMYYLSLLAFVTPDSNSMVY